MKAHIRSYTQPRAFQLRIHTHTYINTPFKSRTVLTPLAFWPHTGTDSMRYTHSHTLMNTLSESSLFKLLTGSVESVLAGLRRVLSHEWSF